MDSIKEIRYGEENDEIYLVMVVKNLPET